MEAARRTGADAGTSQLPLPLPGACNGLSPSPSSKPVFGEDLYAELNSHVARTSEAATSPVFALEDGLGFISFCVQSIVQDQFTACFQPKPRRWVERWTPDLPIVIGSWIVRYLILFPWRMLILLGHTLVFFLLLPFVLLAGSVDGERWLFTFYCKGFVRSFGSNIRFHGTKPKLQLKQKPSIFVSNHTSFIDFLVLSSHEFPHAVIMQKQGGLMGWFQRYILRLNGSLVFERKIKNDRVMLVKKMREHVYDHTRSPLLIFPEGTCVSNEATVLFHKGAFEYDGAFVCPVAIKYDKTRLDPYWHTREQTFISHILYLMTRWGLKADVWYLPPTTRRPNESVTDFAYRVKTDISNRAGLKNLSWDGYMKHGGPAREKREKFKETGQQTMAEGIKRRFQEQYTRSKLVRKMQRSHSIGCLRDFFFNRDQGAVALKPGDEVPDETEDGGEELFELQNQTLVAREEFGVTSGAVVENMKSRVIQTWKEYSRISQRHGDANARRTEYWSWRLWARDRKRHQQEMAERALKQRENTMTMLQKVPSGIFDLVGGVLGRKRTASGSGIKVSELAKSTDWQVTSEPEDFSESGVRRREGRSTEPDDRNLQRMSRSMSGGFVKPPRVVKAS